MHILGTKVHKVTLSQAIARANRFLESSRQHYIVTPNPEIILCARTNPRYRAVLNKASLSIPDGSGIVWASKRLYGRSGLRERVAGVDFMQVFLKSLSNRSYWSYRSYKVLLLGGRNNSAHNAANILQKQSPNVAFYALGNEKSRHLKFIINEIIQPDCIFAALGAPKQETWIARNLSKLPSVKLAMGVGGAFDMISGKTPRAPSAIRALRAEWLWRLFLEPWRLPRILRAVIIFPLFIMKNCRF